MTRQFSLAGRSLLAVLALVYGLDLASAAAAEKVRLGLNLKAGQSYRSNFNSEQKIKQTIQGQQINMDQTMGFGYTFAVQSVDAEGNATCRVTYTSVLFKQAGPAGNVDYDSQKATDNVPAQAKSFAALVDQSLTLRISSQGRVDEVQGTDALLEKVCKAVDLPNDATRETLRKQLNEQFGDRAMKEQMEQILAIYPDKPVGLGDSWSRRITVSAGFPLILENTYKLRERKDGMALIDVSSKMSKNPDGKPMKIGTATLSFDLSGKQQGRMELAEDSGWVIKSELTQEFSGTLKMEGAPGMTEALSWPISAEAKVRLEVPK
jgi:hypothetical protein